MNTKQVTNLLFMPLDIERPPDIDLDYLDSLEDKHFWLDEYRNCRHLPIHVTRGGDWFFTQHYPQLNEWLQTHIWPITGQCRVVIICTQPGETNPPHIDCSPDMFSNLNHKIRYVYRGRVDDLVFMGKGETKRVPNIDAPFVMDGSWPHWMKNNTDCVKYTLAIGSPWEATLQDKDYLELLEHSFDYAQFDEFYISSLGLELPDNYKDFYEPKYKEN